MKKKESHRNVTKGERGDHQGPRWPKISHASTERGSKCVKRERGKKVPWKDLKQNGLRTTRVVQKKKSERGCTEGDKSTKQNPKKKEPLQRVG